MKGFNSLNIILGICAGGILAQTQTEGILLRPPGLAPAPTTPPNQKDAARLFKRYFTTVCGYATTDDTFSYYCDAGYVCGFNTASQLFGCCGSHSGTQAYDCYMPTTCANYGELKTPLNSVDITRTFSCTEAEYPYCATYYESGMSAFGCNEYPSQTAVFQYTLNGGGNLISTTTTSRSSSASFIIPNNSVVSGGSETITAAVGPAVTSTAFSQTQASGSITQQLPTAAISRSAGLRAAPLQLLNAKFALFIALLVLSIW